MYLYISLDFFDEIYISLDDIILCKKKKIVIQGLHQTCDHDHAYKIPIYINMLGVENKVVIFVPFQLEWPEYFVSERHPIQKALLKHIC